MEYGKTFLIENFWFSFLSAILVLVFCLFGFVILYLAVDTMFFAINDCQNISKELSEVCFGERHLKAFSYIVFAVFIIPVIFLFSSFHLIRADHKKFLESKNINIFTSSFVFIFGLILFVSLVSSHGKYGDNILIYKTLFDAVYLSFLFLVMNIYVVFYYKKQIELRDKEIEK